MSEHKLKEKLRPKVAILIPSDGEIKAWTAMSLASLCAFSALRGVSLALIEEQASMVTRARNHLAWNAVRQGADWLLFIDSDMTFPPDAMLRLVNHDKDIVGATYCKRVPPYEMLGRFKEDAKPTDALVEADALPAGFLLIRANAISGLPMPWFFESNDESAVREENPAGLISEDINFCVKAKAHGLSIFCDLSLSYEVGHIGSRIFTIDRPK